MGGIEPLDKTTPINSQYSQYDQSEEPEDELHEINATLPNLQQNAL